MLDKKTVKKADNFILMVSGGIGRNIMATAVVRNLKRAYPDKDIIVLAGSPDVFLKNPHIKRVINMAQPTYFYEDYIRSSKSIFLSVEPYQSFNYIYKEKHFVECWCEMIGIPCEDVYPEIYFSETEKRMAELYVQKFDKEMVLIQHTGGKIPQDKSEKAGIISKSAMYKRSLPEKTVQTLTDVLIERGYMVGSVQHENQFCSSGAEKINFPVRAIIALIPYVSGVICIDSFLMHGTAVFKRKALALWGGTSPKILGYPHNLNLVREVCDNPMCHRPNSFLFDIEPTGFMWDCPFDDKCMNYSVKEILEGFEKVKGGKESARREQGKDFRKFRKERVLDAATGKIENASKGKEGTGFPAGEAIPADSGAVGSS